MKDLYIISPSEIENTLWEVGLNFHNLSMTQRKKILNEISSKSKKLLDHDIHTLKRSLKKPLNPLEFSWIYVIRLSCTEAANMRMMSFMP